MPEREDDDPATENETPDPHLSERITVRVTDTEKWVLQLLARQEGLSVGRYVMKLARAAGRSRTDRLREAVDALKEQESARRRRRRHRAAPPTRNDVLGRFRSPFLRRDQAKDFEAVISISAQRMGISELSAARFVTFFLEAIATTIASGGIVRLPAFGMFGPWHSDRAKGVDGCLPRFVASEPLRNFVQWECPARLNRNHELQAQRRRRRRRPCSIQDAMETVRRHIGSQNREAQAAFEEWMALGS